MSETFTTQTDPNTEHGATGQAADPRQQLLSGLAVTERHVDLAGIRTAIIEGGGGPPVILLHGPGEHAPKWRYTIEGLVDDHHVIAPDLPGHGASGSAGGALDPDRLVPWLDALIDECCEEPPVLVGHIVGGAIAARYAAERGDQVDRLVLVDSLGLAAFDPAPEFGQVLQAFVERPGEETHEGLWQRCAYDLDRLRERMGDRWASLKAYNIDRMQSPETRDAMASVMEHFGFPPLPSEALERISVPTALIWGREDLATAVSVAEGASERYGWPLYVIDDAADDPPLERPEAFVHVLRSALGVRGGP